LATKDIIYLFLLVVNVVMAIYMGFLAWRQRKSDKHIKLAIPVFIALSVLGMTQILHLLISENIWFTIKNFCDIIQLIHR
jgi:hypothetical protein